MSEHFGEFVRRLRITHKITLREFCRTLKLNPSNWSKVERGIHPPTLSDENLTIAAGLLNVPVTELSRRMFADGLPPKVLTEVELARLLPPFPRKRDRAEKTYRLTENELRALAEAIRETQTPEESGQ